MKKLLLVLAIFLSGCATAPVLTTAEQQARFGEQQRATAAWFAAHPTWGMSGRVAVSAPTGSGSGRLDWANRTNGYVASISAPITRQTWRLTQSPAGSLLEGIPNGPLSGPSAEELLFQASGWRIPLDRLQNWLKGITPTGGNVILDPRTGLPSSFREGTWTVTYDEWSAPSVQSAADAASDVSPMPAMPKRITATIGTDTRVKLAIDSWQPAATAD